MASLIKIDLRLLIILLSLSSMFLTVTYIIYGGYNLERELLLQQALESKRAYAMKQAETLSDLFSNLQQQLAYGAREIEKHISDPNAAQSESTRLLEQNNSFNSVLFANHEGIIQASAPQNAGLDQLRLQSSGTIEALNQRKPIISDPYLGTTGRLIIMVSEPIYSGSLYRGFLGGTIYLRDINSLAKTLGTHFYRDGSYSYVVDDNGKIVYHPDQDRVGEQVNPTLLAEHLNNSDNTPARYMNGEQDLLMGHATVAPVNWHVIVERPTDFVLAELNQLIKKMLATAIPFLFVLLALIGYFATLIATPLHSLATAAEGLENPDSIQKIEGVRSWYFEARQIKHTMLRGLLLLNKKLGHLEKDRLTDPLTGLQNRRGMQLVVNDWLETEQQFAVIMCDIDHFKEINDNFGHNVGDIVLQYLAAHLERASRSTDIVCRIGGEEFLMLLPETPLSLALTIAERLRADLAALNSPTGSPITISAGVASWNRTTTSFEALLESADQALYQAKRNGRNRVETLQSAPPA